MIFDKIIPQGYADQIEADINRTQFPWYYIHDVTNKSYGSNSGFVHVAIDFGKEPTEWYPFVKPIIYSIEEAMGHRVHQLLRIRVGLLTKNTEATYDYNTPHVDFLMPHVTACYYVNDSDGDTILFDQTLQDMNTTELSETTVLDYVKRTNFTVAERCAPKKGRLFAFEGKQFHASSMPKQHDRRIVITINYIPEHYAP